MFRNVLSIIVALTLVLGALNAQTSAQTGRPDLQGIWGFATVTPLQRPKEFADKETLTPEEKANLEERAVRDQFVDRPPPPGTTGSYNKFWSDSGTKVVATNRTSLIVDPPDGRVPPLTTHGKAREAALEARAKIAAGPEDLTTWDRCILGFNAGPPMIGGGYNAYVQLFQTPDYLVILNEMVHDARIIPLDGRPPLSSDVRQWRGDSRGRWDGDTLVIETSNVNDKVFERGVLFGVGGDLQLTERFRRTGADSIDYQFTVNAPGGYTRPWTVAAPMARIDGPIFEYACHEGNYAVPNILKGARAQDK
jgi:hypothetical protein